MKWLVTGGLGFIGSHFIDAALDEYPELDIVCLDANTYAAGPIRHHSRVYHVDGKIQNRSLVQYCMSGVSKVINFAAESHVNRSIENAEEFYETNILGVGTLLDFARKNSVERFLQVSTDEVYGNNPFSSGFVESEKLYPNNPYAASKTAAEYLVRANWTTYGLDTIITRGCNTYGPRQYPEKLIPLAIEKLLAGQPVPIYGDGKQERQWIHVKDHVDGILHALKFGISGGIYNIAGNWSLTNLELVRTLIYLCGLEDTGQYYKFLEDRPGHDRRYFISGGLMSIKGWKPEVNFTQGLTETVQWYKGNK